MCFQLHMSEEVYEFASFPPEPETPLMTSTQTQDTTTHSSSSPPPPPPAVVGLFGQLPSAPESSKTKDISSIIADAQSTLQSDSKAKEEVSLSYGLFEMVSNSISSDELTLQVEGDVLMYSYRIPTPGDKSWSSRIPEVETLVKAGKSSKSVDSSGARLICGNSKYYAYGINPQGLVKISSKSSGNRCIESLGEEIIEVSACPCNDALFACRTASRELYIIQVAVEGSSMTSKVISSGLSDAVTISSFQWMNSDSPRLLVVSPTTIQEIFIIADKGVSKEVFRTEKPIQEAIPSPDSQLLAILYGDHSIQIFSFASSKLGVGFQFDSKDLVVAWTSSSSHLLLFDKSQNKLVSVDIETGKVLSELKLHFNHAAQTCDFQTFGTVGIISYIASKSTYTSGENGFLFIVFDEVTTFKVLLVHEVSVAHSMTSFGGFSSVSCFELLYIQPSGICKISVSSKNFPQHVASALRSRTDNLILNPSSSSSGKISELSLAPSPFSKMLSLLPKQSGDALLPDIRRTPSPALSESILSSSFPLMASDGTTMSPFKPSKVIGEGRPSSSDKISILLPQRTSSPRVDLKSDEIKTTPTKLKPSESSLGGKLDEVFSRNHKSLLNFIREDRDEREKAELRRNEAMLTRITELIYDVVPRSIGPAIEAVVVSKVLPYFDNKLRQFLNSLVDEVMTLSSFAYPP